MLAALIEMAVAVIRVYSVYVETCGIFTAIYSRIREESFVINFSEVHKINQTCRLSRMRFPYRIGQGSGNNICLCCHCWLKTKEQERGKVCLETVGKLVKGEDLI